jgi:cytochrome b6-f complex iron-sulfur subunit
MTCTRRVVLQTIGAGTVGCLMPACSSEESLEGGVPTGKATMCGNNLCMSLTENPELKLVGGILFFTQVPNQKVFVMRASESEFRVLSAICTHQGCTVAWNESTERFDCPCHGSQYTATGTVMKGPAGSPLRTFTPELAGDQLTILFV